MVVPSPAACRAPRSSARSARSIASRARSARVGLAGDFLAALGSQDTQPDPEPGDEGDVDTGQGLRYFDGVPYFDVAV